MRTEASKRTLGLRPQRAGVWGLELNQGEETGEAQSAPATSDCPTPLTLPPGTALDVQVPENPVVALVGTDTTLRCSFSPEPGFSLAQLNLIWQLTDTKQLVHSFTQGQDQGSAYANRTALFPDLLAQGNASLRLRRVRVADEGSFTCFVSVRDFGSAAVSLQVAGERRKGAPQPPAHPSHSLAPCPLPGADPRAHSARRPVPSLRPFPPCLTLSFTFCPLQLPTPSPA